MPLFHLEGSVRTFSKELLPMMSNREPSYEEALNWIQSAFTGDTKGQYAAQANTAFHYFSPMEVVPLFLPGA